jgi:hypothetical protein
MGHASIWVVFDVIGTLSTPEAFAEPRAGPLARKRGRLFERTN